MSKPYQELFEKFINRTISPEELEELFEWVDKNRDFKDFDILKKAWTDQDTIEALDPVKTRRIRTMVEMRIREERVQGTTKYIKMNPWWGRVAAGVIILIAMGVGWRHYMNTDIVIKSGYGEITEVVLPDQSVVRLNANSSISYPRRWESQTVRTVDLDGEAFFEVSKDLVHHKKFVVNTNDLKVEVLGTEFNVNTRAVSTKVYLESGSVKLRTPNGRDSLMMMPGDEAGINLTGALTKVSLEKEVEVTDWKDGSVVLKDTKLSEILKEFKDVFGVEYTIAEPVLLDQSFTIVFPITNQRKATIILQNLVGRTLIPNRNNNSEFK